MCRNPSGFATLKPQGTLHFASGHPLTHVTNIVLVYFVPKRWVGDIRSGSNEASHRQWGVIPKGDLAQNAILFALHDQARYTAISLVDRHNIGKIPQTYVVIIVTFSTYTVPEYTYYVWIPIRILHWTAAYYCPIQTMDSRHRYLQSHTMFYMVGGAVVFKQHHPHHHRSDRNSSQRNIYI